MAKQRVWIAGAAMVAALAAVPLAKAGQASAQPTKVAQAQVSSVQAAARPEQLPSQAETAETGHSSPQPPAPGEPERSLRKLRL